MGKAYGHRRESKNDNLQTPISMSEQLFENEPFDFTKDVLECACGEGAIQHVLNQKFKDVFAFDIREGFYYKQDFFDYKEKHTYIVSNPPFSKFNQFIEKSKEVAIEKFALLGKLDFLSGLARYENKIYTDINYPLTKVYVFIRKPDLREWREDGMYKTGIDAYAWYVWENKRKWGHKELYRDYPIISWIDNQRYVLKQDKKK